MSLLKKILLVLLIVCIIFSLLGKNDHENSNSNSKHIYPYHQRERLVRPSWGNGMGFAKCSNPPNENPWTSFISGRTSDANRTRHENPGASPFIDNAFDRVVDAPIPALAEARQYHLQDVARFNTGHRDSWVEPIFM
jgi:hypothetical protein